MVFKGAGSVGGRAWFTLIAVGLLVVVAAVTYIVVHFVLIEWKTTHVHRAQISAKRSVLLTLENPRSAQFRNVEAYILPAVDGGPTFYAFCGSVDVRSPLNRYNGNRRFIALPNAVWLDYGDHIDRGGFKNMWNLLCDHKHLFSTINF